MAYRGTQVPVRCVSTRHSPTDMDRPSAGRLRHPESHPGSFLHFGTVALDLAPPGVAPGALTFVIQRRCDRVLGHIVREVVAGDRLLAILADDLWDDIEQRHVGGADLGRIVLLTAPPAAFGCIWPWFRTSWRESRAKLVAQGRIELPTSRLSGVRSPTELQGKTDPLRGREDCPGTGHPKTASFLAGHGRTTPSSGIVGIPNGLCAPRDLVIEARPHFLGLSGTDRKCHTRRDRCLRTNRTIGGPDAPPTARSVCQIADLVDPVGLEPTASCVQSRRSPR